MDNNPSSPSQPGPAAGLATPKSGTPSVAAMPGVQASSSGTPVATGLDLRLRTFCIKALQQLRAGFSQALLYAQDTKQYEKSAEATFEALNLAVNELGAFHISISRSE